MTQKYEVVLSSYAQRDIKNIGDYIYYNLNAPLAAVRNVEDLYNTIQNLAQYPYRFSHCNNLELAIRKIREQQFKHYRITYIVDEPNRRVAVLRVLHTLSNHTEDKYTGLQNEVDIFKK
ncbi:type II toxin-antitoxin system RelE/ParE family toxin [Hominibacterium faecale]|uniref:type II toxin-antitoxin system RelE/ParE family toxin n=1 Tax=Hominibacterium faecale TaxID=2839743 RepID=UPI0039EC6A2F